MSNLPAINGDFDLPEVPTSRNSINLLQVVWQRKSLVVLGVIIGLVLGSLYWAQRAPTYLSFANVLVVKKTPDALTGGQMSAMIMEDYMSTQSTILRSQEIAKRAAESREIKEKFEKGELKSFAVSNLTDLAFEMMGALTVGRDTKESAAGPQSGNNVLVLSFKGPDAHECQLFLEKIIWAYQNFLDEKYKSQSDALMAQIKEARDKLEKDVNKAHTDLADHRMSSDDVYNSKQAKGTSVLQKNYEMLSQEIANSRMKLKSNQSDCDFFQKLYDEKGAQETIAALMAAGHRSIFNGDSDVEKSLTQLQIRRHELLGRLGPKHPEVVQIDRQMEAIRRTFFKKKAEVTGQDTSDLEQDAAALFVKGLHNEVDRLSRRIDSLQIEYEELMGKMRKADAADLKEEMLQRSLVMQEQLFQAVVSKIQQIDMSKGGGFEATAITRPGIGRKIAPIPFQVFTAAALLGTLLGIGLAYLAEVSDKSFRNPTEIRKRLGLPVIGHVPYLAPDEKAQHLIAGGTPTVDPMLITHYQSNSIGAEAYRGVRTALYFSTRGENHKVIQVTSPNVSDGKSTLAANLAASIAQSGKRTLLIDADFRKPRVHKIFNVPAQTGMASVMAGQCDLASAIQPTAVPNLSVLPCGPRPVNPAELLTSPRFKELLDELRTQFEFVIVDTPPILVVTDPAVVAPRVDGVVLCIRVTKNGRPYAERAREVLLSLGANVIGVVVNGFGSQVSGGKYGYEHYQYGVGDGYSYTYADKEAASYYAADKADDRALPPADND